MEIILLRKKGSGISSLRQIKEQWIKLFKEDKVTIKTNLNNGNNGDNIVRWGTTEFPEVDKNNSVLNTANSIALTSNKPRFRILCGKKEINIPPTYYYGDHKTIDLSDMEYPAIVRPSYHQGGNEFHVVNTQAEYQRIKKENPRKNYYISKWIKKIKEYRVFFFDGYIMSISEKMIKEDLEAENLFSWNHDNGFYFEYVGWKNWKRDLCEMAINVAKISKLDFGAIDIMEDKDGKLYFLEINTSIGLESPYKAELFSLLIRSAFGEEELPEFSDKSSKRCYKEYIHPIIRKRALTITREKVNGE